MSDAHDPKHSGQNWSRSRRHRVGFKSRPIPARSADDIALALISHMQLYAGPPTWFAPHVTKLDDSVVLEWWHNERKITIDVHTDKIEYMRVWGDNIDTEMADGELPLDLSGAHELWDWLVANTGSNTHG